MFNNVKKINAIFVISRPPLICFMVNNDINKYLNTFLSFPNQATPLKLRNNLNLALVSSQKDLRIFRKKVRYSYEKKFSLLATCQAVQFRNRTFWFIGYKITGNNSLSFFPDICSMLS